MLAACSKDIINDGDSSDMYENKTANSLLQVRTRAGGNEATISYPVQVYVFQGEDCKAVQTIGDEGQTLNIALVEGAYSVYAIGGASATDYELPTKNDATTTSAIALKDSKTLTDLMTAKANVTLVDGGTNTVTLGLERKVMLLQDITISKVPTAATAVSVTISPLWENVTIGGTYSGTNGNNTIALTKQADGRTWTTSANAFFLPPSDIPASISVNITIGGTTKSYTYSTCDELEAGYKINIEGTYTEAVGVSLTGTITGATWLGERTITFNFDENGSSTNEGDNNDNPDNNDNNNSGNDNGGGGDSSWLPTIGSTYQGCTVLSATATSDETADLLLLAPTETAFGGSPSDALADIILGNVATATGISDWHVPTVVDMAAFSVSGALTPGGLYAYRRDEGKYKRYQTGTDFADFGAPNADQNTLLRPVAEVSVNKE